MGVLFASNQNLAAEKAVKDGHTLHRLLAKEVRGMQTLAVIPARYSSTRLPGKPMIEIAGVPLVIPPVCGHPRFRSGAQRGNGDEDHRPHDLLVRRDPQRGAAGYFHRQTLNLPRIR